MTTVRTKNRRKAGASARRASAAALLPRLRGLGIALGVLLLVAGGIFGGEHAYQWLHQTPMLALHQVSILGNKRATSAELQKLAVVRFGENLLRLDIDTMERSLSLHPWVRRVEVRRRFPHTLSVQVEEHVPTAMVSLGDLYVVNDEGDPFKRLHAQDGLDLPLLTGVDREDFVSRRDETKGRLKEALEMAAAYEGSMALHGAPLSEVRLGADGVTLVTGSTGQEVRMGRGGTREKIARLAKVRTELARRGISAGVIRLDNRSRPGWVAVKLAVNGSERTEGLPQ